MSVVRDWGTCERCGYSLKGLAATSCPECGHLVGVPVPNPYAWLRFLGIGYGLVGPILQTGIVFRYRNTDPLWAIAMWVPLACLVVLGGAVLVDVVVRFSRPRPKRHKDAVAVVVYVLLGTLLLWVWWRWA